MGLESIDIPTGIFDTYSDTIELKSRLTELGWQEVNFGFNLGRKTGALDLQKGEQRILVYQSPLENQTTYQTLVTFDIPRLEIIAQAPRNIEGHTLTVLNVPKGTRGLDSMNFKETQSVAGYLGAFEIIDGIVRFLGSVYEKTAQMPDDLTLSKLALVPGEQNMIRLLPPLLLLPSKSWDKLIKEFADDLNKQDPYNNHTEQINFLRINLAHYINQSHD